MSDQEGDGYYDDDDGRIDLDDALYSDDERLPLFDEINRLRGGRRRKREDDY